jgi:hypothetical protein
VVKLKSFAPFAPFAVKLFNSKAFGNHPGMLIDYGTALLKCHSEEPVLFPATKNLACSPRGEILRHSGAGKERPAPPFLRMT